MSGSHREAKADACVEAGLVVSKMCCFGPYSDPIDQRVWKGPTQRRNRVLWVKTQPNNSLFGDATTSMCSG